jgi:plastocyanin
MLARRALLWLLAATAPLPASAASVTITVRTAEGKPLENAVVSIETPSSRPGTPPAFSYPLRVTQQNIQFSPYVLLVPVGATVAFPNLDKVRHHVYSFSRAKKFELKLYGRDETNSVTFDKAGTVPLGCNIHDAMSAFVKVVATPFAGKSGPNGQVVLRNLPAGQATVRVWHPSAAARGNEFSAPLQIGSADLAQIVTLQMVPGK